MAIAQLMEAVRPHIESGAVPGVIVGLLYEGEHSLVAAGSTAPSGGTELAADGVLLTQVLPPSPGR